MISLAKLLELFWGKEARNAYYLFNLFPSVPRNGDILERILSRKDVSCSYLWMFGCIVFVRVPKHRSLSLMIWQYQTFF